MRIPLEIEYLGEIDLGVDIPEEVELSLETRVNTSDVPEYTGNYTYTPTEDTQIVNISGKMAMRNITINPIPNNYGLITYNGVSITVS